MAIRAIACPSIATIEKYLGLDRAKAKEVRELMTGEKSPNSYESVKKWCAQCYNEPSYDEKVMCALNEVLEGFGVEVIDTENARKPIYVNSFYRYFTHEYINMGDTYTPTIIRNCDSGRFMVGTWGDIAEKFI